MHKIIQLIGKILQACDAILCKIGIKRPTVVVALDGGICSQIFNYLKGARFAEAGYNVLYDTRWFEQSGKDLTGLFTRKYELQEMFPSLPIHYVSAEKTRRWYSRFFKHTQPDGLVNIKDVKRTTYFGSHYAPDNESYIRLFSKFFNEQTMCPVEVPWSRREGVIHCGVHVRRGDLAIQRPEYGMVSNTYFENAIKKVQTLYPMVQFHFFSDEMDWVKENILPKVDINYDLVQGNKAWQDLALLTHNDIIIASQGSFGRTAARLKEHAIIVLCEADLISDYLGKDTKVIFVE